MVRHGQYGNDGKRCRGRCKKRRSGGATSARRHSRDADVLASDVILFGCPAMGSEELEEGEFEPFFSSVESGLSGKRVGLFGSYDWGDGEWMRSWQARVVSNGGVMIEDGIIANNTPDDAALSACRALGEKAAK